MFQRELKGTSDPSSSTFPSGLSEHNMQQRHRGGARERGEATQRLKSSPSRSSVWWGRLNECDILTGWEMAFSTFNSIMSHLWAQTDKYRYMEHQTVTQATGCRDASGRADVLLVYVHILQTFLPSFSPWLWPPWNDLAVSQRNQISAHC